MNLAREKIPRGAYQVIVYAKIQSGNVQGKDQTGELVVSTSTFNGLIERKLLYHVYPQSSWSFNSENIGLPIEDGYTTEITAELRGPDGGNFSASVQVIGYFR